MTDTYHVQWPMVSQNVREIFPVVQHMFSAEPVLDGSKMNIKDGGYCG